MKAIGPAFVLVFGIAAAISGGAAFGFTDQQLSGEAKVSQEQARAIALRAFPGMITDQELEKERGGSGLRYSFDIKSGAMTHEVGVDARTGAVLENPVEGKRDGGHAISREIVACLTS
jgi:hypothetical protein